MEEDRNRFETVFKCDLETTSDTVNLCIAFIEANVDEEDMDLGITTRIKWVITEMLTNAIKHSAVEECQLTIRINGKQLFFEKRDNGNPLSLNKYESGRQVKWPLKDESFPKSFQVYHNGSESLSAFAENPNQVVFFVHEIASEEMPALLLNTSEHFGLLILTKASDHFEYQHEPVSGINRFCSTFNLQNP